MNEWESRRDTQKVDLMSDGLNLAVPGLVGWS